MEQLLKVSELNDLIKQVTKGEITFSKMTEIINFKHLEALSILRFEINKKNMRTYKKVPIEIVHCHYIPNEMEFGKFYYSSEYKVSNHLCVCGCGQQTPLPIKDGEWEFGVIDNKLTVKPSILHRMGCKSHYVITYGVANVL